MLLEGPRLGYFYDFLLRQRPAMPVSQELLIIDSRIPGQEPGEDILEPGAASSLLYTMTELGAETLIIQVPILGLSAGGSAGEEEILYRFNEEFSLLSRNIHNLFDAIRTGSVAPSESTRYVGELVDLSEKGKERLVSALVRRDEEGISKMEKAEAFFGHVRRPMDLRVQLIQTFGYGQAGALAGTSEYSRASPDRDGIFRRIKPVLEVSDSEERSLDHIIYGALKTRFQDPRIEYADFRFSRPDETSGFFLNAWDSLRGKNNVIPLDRNKAIIFEVPHGGDDFRRIGIADFLSYDEADRSLRHLLLEGESLGIFQSIEGENNPCFLYDYALSLRDEYASSPLNDTERIKSEWIRTRNNYFIKLDNFLYGPTEMNLVEGYEEIIASESLEEAEIARIALMRDSLIRTFIGLREKHYEVAELRTKLENALQGSFCILGKGSIDQDRLPSRTREPNFFILSLVPPSLIRGFQSVFHWTNPTNAEVSALLANSILTGRVVKPGHDLYLLILSIFWTFIICLVIKSAGPIPSLVLGLFLTLLIGAGFSASFVFSGLWLDPLVPTASGGAAVLVSFIWISAAKSRFSRRFRLAYGPYVSRPCVRSVIRNKGPLPSQVISVRAAVVAVKYSDPDVKTEAGKNIRTLLGFQKKASEVFKKAGGTIIGCDGDMVTVCFGSPLERIYLGGKRKISPYEDNIFALAAPAIRAVDVISETAWHPEYEFWNYGLDLGNCTFAWTELQGYFAHGNPVIKARLLSRLTSRYKARIIISAEVNESLPDQAVKKLDVIKGKDGDEAIYRLAVRS